MDHQFLAMTKQRVIVLVLADGKRDFTPTGEAKTVVGCEVCNMGLDGHAARGDVDSWPRRRPPS
jgi:hypothetical protein